MTDDADSRIETPAPDSWIETPAPDSWIVTDGGDDAPLRSPPQERSVAELLRFGVVNLDKPPGPSAHQVAGWVRDLVNDCLEAGGGEPIEGAAHAGTLDPKVTGCLPVLTGDATRAAQVFLEGGKEYVAVLELHGDPPADLDSVVAEFETEIYQKPPRKSAVARRLRTREIYDLDVLEIDRDERRALLRIRCESGTYVRKLCHDLGLALGTGGHMGHLRRTATDPFDDCDLRTLHDLADALVFAGEGDEGDDHERDASALREVVEPAEAAFEHLPTVTIARSAAREVATGAPVYAPGVVDTEPADTDELVVCVTPDASAVCLGHMVGDPDADDGTVVSLERVLV